MRSQSQVRVESMLVWDRRGAHIRPGWLYTVYIVRLLMQLSYHGRPLPLRDPAADKMS